MKILFLVLSLVISGYCDDFNIDIKKSNSLEVPSPKLKTEKITDKNVNDFFNYLDRVLSGYEKPKEKSLFKSINKSAEIYNFDLNKILDKYLYTPVKFKTSKQTEVTLSVSKSYNCPGGANNCRESDKFLLTFTYGTQTAFIKIKDIINLGIFMHGSKSISIDGETYTARAYANISDPNKREIEIKGPNGVVLNKKLGEMLDIFSNFGYKAILNKKYRIVYGRKVICDSNACNFSNDKMVFIVEYPLSKDSNYYTLDEKSSSGNDLYFESIGKNFFFKITDGHLIITKN